jgi:DNA-binding response OmpR family regulator
MNESSVKAGRILVVDDEANIRDGLRAVLERQGHEVRTADSADSALRELAVFSAEVIILDIRMPGMTGIDLLPRLREHRPPTAVILLTGHGSLQSAMAAIRENAFDYLLKPASPVAIQAALARALHSVRRQRSQVTLLDTLRSGLADLEPEPQAESTPAPPAASPVWKLGDLIIDPARHTVWCRARTIDLTPTEYRLLVALLEKGGATLDYISAVRLTLGFSTEKREAKELIKRHIFTLRQKIEPDPSRPQLILNIRGVGYRAAL